MADPLHSSVLRDPDLLREAIPAWRELLADSDCNHPFLSPEWLLTWWDIYGKTQGRQLCVVCLRRGTHLVGLVPLLRRCHWYRPGLPFRRLELLGSGEREEEAICSDYLNAITRRGHEEAVADAFLTVLQTGQVGRWQELVIPLMDGTHVMPTLLIERAKKIGWHGELTPATRAAYIELPGTWEEFLAQLGKKERYLINRSMRDFDQWAEGTAKLEEATISTLKQGRQILESLHQQRWQGTEGGTFRAGRFVSFHERVMELLLEHNALELIWLNVRGEAVAAMYNIRWNGKIYFYQCGRKIEVPRNIRPGGVIIYQAIRRAIESGYREFDFLGGEAVYKKQLTQTFRPLVQLRICRPSLVESTRKFVDWGKEQLRPLWYRMRGKQSIQPHQPTPSSDNESSEKG